MGQDVLRWQDVFEEEGLSDVEWLNIVGPKGWILLTWDKRIRRRNAEIQAVRDSGAKLFFVQRMKTGAEQAQIVCSHLRKIIKISDDYVPPFIASITESKVEVVPHDLLPQPCRRSAVKR